MIKQTMLPFKFKMSQEDITTTRSRLQPGLWCLAVYRAFDADALWGRQASGGCEGDSGG